MSPEAPGKAGETTSRGAPGAPSGVRGALCPRLALLPLRKRGLGHTTSGAPLPRGGGRRERGPTGQAEGVTSSPEAPRGAAGPRTLLRRFPAEHDPRLAPSCAHRPVPDTSSSEPPSDLPPGPPGPARAAQTRPRAPNLPAPQLRIPAPGSQLLRDPRRDGGTREAGTYPEPGALGGGAGESGPSLLAGPPARCPPFPQDPRGWAGPAPEDEHLASHLASHPASHPASHLPAAPRALRPEGRAISSNSPKLRKSSETRRRKNTPLR